MTNYELINANSNFVLLEHFIIAKFKTFQQFVILYNIDFLPTIDNNMLRRLKLDIKICLEYIYQFLDLDDKNMGTFIKLQYCGFY